MSVSKPPNGMARAYRNNLSGVITVWNGEYYVSFRRDAFPASHIAEGRDTPIPEWDAMDKDNYPEWVMVPKQLCPGTRVPDDAKFFYPANDGRASWDRATAGPDDWARRKTPVVYQREDSHPSVLRRVWTGGEPVLKPGVVMWMSADGKSYVEDDGVPLRAVNWSLVHSGDLVPPGRVAMPEIDQEDVARVRVMSVWFDGNALFYEDPMVNLCSFEAAHYSLSGHLIGHRMKGGGWKEVSQDAGSPPSPPEPKRKESAPEVTAAMTGYTQSDMPAEARSFDSQDYFYGPRGVHARRELAGAMAYLEHGPVANVAREMGEAFGGFQVMSVSLQDRRPPEAIEQEQREYRDAIRNELARRAIRAGI